MNNVIINPFFAIATQANRGATKRDRQAGIRALLDLHETTECRWTAASASSELVSFHGVYLTWNEESQTYDVSRGPKLRPRNAEIVPLAEIRAARAGRPVPAEAKSGISAGTTNPAA
jgi:hypothetical protein